MKFLIDRCAGHKLALWLATQGHEVLESKDLGADPGDQQLLRLALSEKRILITIDTDFGKLIFSQGQTHRGLIRLPDVPDVPPARRIEIMTEILKTYPDEMEEGAIITVRGNKIRISRST